MKKNEMVRAIANDMDNITIMQVRTVIDLFFNKLVECLQNDDYYNQKNFGTFKRIDRASRKGRNPQTKEIVIIPPTKSLKIVLSNKLKQQLNEK